MVDEASLTDDGTRFLVEQLHLIQSKIKEMNNRVNFAEESQRKTSSEKTCDIKDPSDIRTKGCGKRMQSYKDKSTSKPRICHGCGQRGVSHDKRNCPVLHDE